MYYITMLPDSYILLDGGTLQFSLEPILRVLYANRGNNTEFVHFHLSSDEASIIIPSRFQSYFGDKPCTSPYIALQIDTDTPGLEEPGILADITALFKRYGISILSESTYRYNYIFVPQHQSEMITKMVAENKDLLNLEVVTNEN